MNNQKTLNLKKECAGYYSNSAGDLTITVSNPAAVVGGKSDWQLNITFAGETIVDEWFKTKKEAYSFAVEWLSE